MMVNILTETSEGSLQNPCVSTFIAKIDLESMEPDLTLPSFYKEDSTEIGYTVD
jgi:hypothetical protein